jgi:tetratricopeptide (TPR) repeat protein
MPAQTVTPSGPRASANAAPPAATSPAPTTAPASGPAPARLREILEASGGGPRDPFAVLDIEPTDDEGAIRQAYFRLARVLHPDSALEPGLDGLRGRRERAFVDLGQAFEKLRQPQARRQAFEAASRRRSATSSAAPAAVPPAQPGAAAAPRPQSPAPEPPTTPPGPPSAPAPGDRTQTIATAQRHFEMERYWDAIQVLEPLLSNTEGTERVRTRMLLAQCYQRNPNWSKRAEETLLELLRESPRYVPAQVLLGDIYRASGLTTRARTAYQRALALQPDHEAASRCLAELQPEVGPETAGAGGLRGVFRKR